MPAPVTDMHLVDARLDRRIVFGSDHVVWSEALERAVESIRQAPLPNAAQKRGILHDNAARFLRREPAGTDGPSRP